MITEYIGTEYTEKFRDNMGQNFDVPDKPSLVCALRATFFKSSSDSKIVSIGGWGAKSSVSRWVGVYGIITPEKELFHNPFSSFKFSEFFA
jgi:hypothetical protein